MHFALMLMDKPDGAAIRNATRAAHIDFIDARLSQVLTGGPLLDKEGSVVGSLVVIEAASRAEAEAFAAADPYQQAGLFASSVVCEYKALIREGVRS